MFKIIAFISTLLISSVFFLSESENNNIDTAEEALENDNPQRKILKNATTKMVKEKVSEVKRLRKLVNETPNLQEELEQTAISSFKQSILQPPEDLPPLSKPFKFSQASEDEIRDKSKYASREASSKRKLKREFVEAAQKKLTEIDQMIVIGKKQGVADYLIQEALDKRRAIARLAESYQKDSSLKE